MNGSDAMWDAIASAAIRQHGKDPRHLRKIIAGHEAELLLASERARAGIQSVITKLKAQLEKLPRVVEAHRGPGAD